METEFVHEKRNEGVDLYARQISENLCVKRESSTKEIF